MKNLYFLLIAIFFLSCNKKEETLTIESPSGSLIVSLETNSQGEISYKIIEKTNDTEAEVLGSSPLGLIFDDADYTENLQLAGLSETKKISDNYSMISGKFSDLSYEANEADVLIKNNLGSEIKVTFRVFDEGVAFRYVVPENTEGKATVKKEATGFAIEPGTKGWMSAYQAAQPWGNPGYEADYIEVEAGDESPEEVGWSFPLLFNSGKKWIYISESGLNSTYCATHLAHDCSGGLYTISLPEENERLGDGDVYPTSASPWEMPWRYILIADSLNEIVESSMVYHLAEPCKLENTSWIKPGRASWEWWSSKGGRTVKKLKEFIDLAAEMEWEYSLVDAGWENMPDGKIEDVIKYADSKNVGLLLWYNSGGRRDSSRSNNEFVMFDDASREAEMAKLENWDIKGIKVDFFATDKQLAIELYENIIKDAARHNLLVNFHGCTLPRGWTRTYPNLLTMEAVRGAECYRFSETYPQIAPFYNTIAAVVRGTAGPADYTPATFSDNRYPHITTSAHELALTVVYESGIIHMADTPEAYYSLPEKAINFLKNVPAAWDETKLIKSVPGELFVVARKKGEKWIIAGINGKNEAQKIDFELPASIKEATLIADGNARDELNIEDISNAKNLSVEMEPNGGFVIY